MRTSRDLQDAQIKARETIAKQVENFKRKWYAPDIEMLMNIAKASGAIPPENVQQNTEVNNGVL